MVPTVPSKRHALMVIADIRFLHPELRGHELRPAESFTG
jgi:hypothetical protein